MQVGMQLAGKLASNGGDISACGELRVSRFSGTRRDLAIPFVRRGGYLRYATRAVAPAGRACAGTMAGERAGDLARRVPIRPTVGRATGREIHHPRLTAPR